MDLFSPTSWVLRAQWGISATDCDQVKPLNRRRLESLEKVRNVAGNRTSKIAFLFILSQRNIAFLEVLASFHKMDQLF